MRLIAAALLWMLASFSPVSAQDYPLYRPSISVATVSPDRLFGESDFGIAFRQSISERQQELSQEYRTTVAALEAEEQQLTDERETLSPEDFQKRAEAFDQKANAFREKQRQDTLDLQQREQAARQRFSEQAGPIIQALMQERGITLLLDVSVVYLAEVESDITDDIIARLNKALPR